MSEAQPPADQAKQRPKRSWTPWVIFALFAFGLYGLLFPNGSGPRGAARRAQAHSGVTQLTFAIWAHYTEFGSVPTGSNAEIMRVLFGENPKKIVFFESSPTQLSPTKEFIDPWRKPYRIDTAEPTKPRIYSFGPNKEDDNGTEGSDDVVNWR